ncbi:hypothetical protein EV06_1061 [Prochlorococcus sp. MIT 0602]|nr:hypothetical protein EV06_1061 [Prochlorococcus sp. MIT 0602]KGG17467.1 hypothetical protein EV07_0907 [Prochlorococcus sp. MIT 0603]
MIVLIQNIEKILKPIIKIKMPVIIIEKGLHQNGFSFQYLLLFSKKDMIFI